MERDGARGALMVLLLLYAAARVLQIFPAEVPTLLIVLLHVAPPALFALIHGWRVYGVKGMAVFMAVCLAVGSLFESISLRTGFPFGRYTFTAVMGPKVLQLPVLLALAYVGVGYAAWVVATLIVGARAHTRAGLVVVPCVAAAAMTAWDMAMDPVWANIDRAWVWFDGGGWFGVPFRNYFGWLLTTWCFYQIFAAWLARQPRRVRMAQWNRLAVLMYGLVAAGNLLLLMPSAVPASWPKTIVDAAGRRWFTTDIVGACALVSLLVMAPFAVIAWIRAGSDASLGTRSRDPPGVRCARDEVGIGIEEEEVAGGAQDFACGPDAPQNYSTLSAEGGNGRVAIWMLTRGAATVPGPRFSRLGLSRRRSRPSSAAGIRRHRTRRRRRGRDGTGPQRRPRTRWWE